MLKKLSVTITMILFLLNCSDSIEAWKMKVIVEKEKYGWLLIYEQLNSKRLAFINIYSTQTVYDNIYFVKILWVNHYSIANGYSEDIFYTIEDCEKDRSSILEGYYNPDSIDLSKLEWRIIEDDLLHPILCESLSVLKIGN